MSHTRDEHLIRSVVTKSLDISTAWCATRDKATSLRAEADEVDKQATALLAQYDACHKTAELFGFDLQAEIDRFFKEKNVFCSPAQIAPGVPSLPSREADEKFSIQDFIAKTAQEAFPDPVRASALRKQLEERGIKTHEKTVGMTLYRLSQKGLMYRSGKADWFFVPQAGQPAEQEQGSSGAEPELSLSAAE